MVSSFFKKSSLLVAALASTCALQADIDRKKQSNNNSSRMCAVQVVVNPAAQGFAFNINNGTGSITNATNLVSTTEGGVTTPLTLNGGGSSTLTGLVFPAGTVNPSQANFNVSTNGTPLTAQNSIGTFTQTANTLENITFNNDATTGDVFPAAGTNAEQVQWNISFNNGCCMQSNNNSVTALSASGILMAGNFGSNQAAFMASNLPATQSSNNGSAINQINSAQVFFSQDLTNPQMLINLELNQCIRL